MNGYMALFTCCCFLFLLSSCGNGKHGELIERLRRTGRRSGTVKHSKSHDDYPNMSGAWIEFPTESEYLVVLEALEGNDYSLFRFYIAAANKTPLPDYGNPHIVMDVPPEEVESIVVGGIARGKYIDAMVKAAADHNWKPVTQGTYTVEAPVTITYESDLEAIEKARN